MRRRTMTETSVQLPDRDATVVDLGGGVGDAVHELVITEVGLAKLARRQISASEAAQIVRNRHAIVRNPRAGGDPGRRRLLIGTTDGGRVLTFVVEQTMEPTTWLIVTGWSATPVERRIIQAKR
jgi:hypothetical protein